MIHGFEPRLYQETILSTCVDKNCLVVLPTGMGKTAIAMLLAVQRLKNFPQSKILFLAPTKPLAEQHLSTFKRFVSCEENNFSLFTGEVPPETREQLWKDVKMIFSTPQGLENDVISKKILLENVSLIIFDEAHRAVGDYSYVFIAKQYMKQAKFPKILALTASPGSDLEKIDEVCKNLFIDGVEIRSDKDPDVQPYVQEMDMKWVKVELPEQFLEIKKFLENCLKSKLVEMKNLGINKSVDFFSKRDLLAMQADFHAKMASGERDFTIMRAVSLLAELMKAQHALELLESQGITALNKYMEKIFSEAGTTKVKAVKNLVQDLNFKSAFIKAQKLFEAGVEHPKLAELAKIMGDEFNANSKAKIILFTQYRDSASKIYDIISKIRGVFPVIFVGQAKKGETGLSQKKQIEILQQFSDGFYNVLIATSVAEEGLDIPRVDLVMFYEPIPSAIRTIQRRGRTGRQEKGRVIVLMAKGTRDEGYRWSAFNKEKRMHTILDTLKNKVNAQFSRQPTLANFTQEGNNIKIFADYREKSSGILKDLCDLGVNIKLEMLECADYILSSRVGVEVKLVDDFVNSIVDGRLLQQLKELKSKFDRPVVIIEGESDIYAVRNVHPNAIQGMLATIAVSYGIPLIKTKNSKETAGILIAIAKREQSKDESKDFSLHTERKPLTLKEQQEYIVSSLPSVGPVAAKELLKYFKSVKSIVNASEDDLKKVDKVGDKIAKGIRDSVEKEYEE